MSKAHVENWLNCDQLVAEHKWSHSQNLRTGKGVKKQEADKNFAPPYMWTKYSITAENRIAAAHQFAVGSTRHRAIAHLFNRFCCSDAALIHDKCISWVVCVLASGWRDVNLVDRSNLFSKRSDILLSASVSNVSDKDLQQQVQLVRCNVTCSFAFNVSVCNTVSTLW
jgi:hypothetical protein